MGNDKEGSKNDSRMRWNHLRAASRGLVGMRKGNCQGNPNPNDKKKKREIGRGLRKIIYLRQVCQLTKQNMREKNKRKRQF